MNVNHQILVEFADVQKTYDGAELVIKNLNLKIHKGEFLTLLGPSGSGKTTCLMMLAGFETPTSGEIYLDGEAINKIPPYKRGIGMVFQNYALFPHMTVYENLSFPLEVRKLNKSEIDEKVKKALDMVELGAFGNRMPLQLSGGQQQRVAIARAIAGNRPLLLADEPTGNLDIASGKDVLQLFKDLCHDEENPISILMVTHDPELAANADRMLLLLDGKTEASDIRTAWGLDDVQGGEEE